MNADEFNERYPVGTFVRYHSVIGESEFVESKTRSEAWTLPSSHDVVQICGRAGCVSLKAIEIEKKGWVRVDGISCG